MNPTWRYCFCLFHSHDPKPKRNHQIASSRAKTRSRRSETCVKSRGIIIWIKRNTYVNTSDLKILNKKCPSKVDFQDIIFNFSKLSHSLHSTWWLTGELGLLQFIWHHSLRVTNCQLSAMIFVFMQYSFCNSFIHCLICLCQSYLCLTCWWRTKAKRPNSTRNQPLPSQSHLPIVTHSITLYLVYCTEVSRPKLHWTASSYTTLIYTEIRHKPLPYTGLLLT